MFQTIATEAAKMQRHVKQTTLSDRSILSAVKQILPRYDIHFFNNIEEQLKLAVATFSNSSSQSNIAIDSNSKSGKKSIASRSNLLFPVGRIKNELKAGNGLYCERISIKSAIALSAVLETLVAEIFDETLEFLKANDYKFKRITSRHLYLAIQHDKDALKRLLTQVVIAQSGVAPNNEKSSLSLPITKQKNEQNINPQLPADMVLFREYIRTTKDPKFEYGWVNQYQ
jgi:hypothetical protein